jgi:hypothetical protein
MGILGELPGLTEKFDRHFTCLIGVFGELPGLTEK